MCIRITCDNDLFTYSPICLSIAQSTSWCVYMHPEYACNKSLYILCNFLISKSRCHFSELRNMTKILVSSFGKFNLF